MPAHNISQEITPELIRTILADCETADLVAFDEAQFFSEGLLELTLGLLDRKKQVMIAGLNLDYLGRPFRLHRTAAAPCGRGDCEEGLLQVLRTSGDVYPAGDRRTAGHSPEPGFGAGAHRRPRRAMKPRARLCFVKD